MEENDIQKMQIANNLKYYRKKAGLTQGELAKKINYSDKAISKWERGDGFPDIFVFRELSKIFSISVDALLNGNKNPDDIQSKRERKLTIKKKFYIGGISFFSVWVLATVLFTCLELCNPEFEKNWLSFIYAAPASMVPILICNWIWGKPVNNIWPVSIFSWTITTAIYLSIPNFHKLWLLFVITGVLQILIIFWFLLRKTIIEKMKLLKNKVTRE